MVNSIFKSYESRYSQSILNKVIPFDQIYTFKVKIVSAPQRYVCIGIVDYEKHSTVSCFYNSEIVVGYFWYI